MEALPRLPMLSFDLKHSPEYIEFGPTLKQYIKDHYGEDPALYNKACTDLEQLRQAAIQVSRDYMGCTTLKKYYTQLEYLQKRFSMGEGGEATISFTWEDVQTGRDHMISDIRFEQACILYNIGSLHSLLGVLDTRHNVEGMRVSCTHFQCAAWVFEHLRDTFSTSTMSTDMSYELLSFHIILMLAQAQECILEKSLVDNRKNNITAKVAAQVVEFYKDASRLIDLADQKQQISSRMHKEWGRRLLMKAAFYQSVTYYCLGRRSQELEKPGECLAYYTAARDELARATQLAKNEVPEVMECLQFAKDVVMGKYDSAKKDNDFVYHDKVPAIESLPEVKGASLAKGIPVNLTDKEISGPDIFQKLVPMEAHEASSVYSEEKAKLSRAVVSEIEQKNMELEQFMSSLQLDVEQLMPKPDLLPETLMEKCAAMSVRTNAIKELTDSMTSVSGLATEVELSIEEIQEMIDEDTEKTDQFEKLYGKKNPSSVLPGLLEDLAGYRKKHEEGNQLNVTLHKAMSTHTSNLKTLVQAPSEIQAMLPPSHPTLSNEDQDVVSEIRRLLQKVSEMKEQRKALLEQFRDKIQKDDITNVLVTQEKTDKESVFTEQLKKHDQLVGYIRQNLSSQDNILRHVTDINAKYALIRQAYNEAIARREKVVQELILSYDKYEELLAKSEKGAEYYKKLLQSVVKTLERSRSECKVRQEERDMLMAKLAPKVPPPSRPTAPKPDLSNAGTPSSVPEATSTGAVPSAEEMGSISTPGQVLPSGQFQSLPPRFEGPKLKDYLPFMKPRSFGPKSPQPSGAPQNVPLPSSIPPDMPQLNSGDFNLSQRYPGLDPSLASVLPATIAQYLASVSSAGTSIAGGGRYSPSQSPSPQHSSSATPPRHSPSPLATPPPSPAIMQGPHPTGYQQPLGQFPTSRHSTQMSLDPRRPHPSQAHSDGTPQQSIPATFIDHTPSQSNTIMHAPPSSISHVPHFAQGTAVQGGAGVFQQPYEQYGYISGMGHSQQYSNMSMHANTSTVSAVSRPILSPGHESTNQSHNFQPHPMMQSVGQQQYPQQWASSYIPPQEQQHQPHHSLSGQIPLPPGQQYEMSGNIPSGQHRYEPTPPQPVSQPQHIPSQSWPQNQFHQSHGSVPGGQGQSSRSEVSSLSTTVTSQSHSANTYGQQQQMRTQQQASLASTPSHGYGPFPQVGGFVGAGPQEMGLTGTKIMGGAGHAFMGGSYSMDAANLHGGGTIPSQSEATQPGGAPYQTGSPHQSPKRDPQSGLAHEGVPVTSVGYRYAKGQHQGPFVSDYAYPNQQMYQNVASTTYQPNQAYVGGYQHGIDRSYQNAQTFGTFTSKACVYGQSSQAISTQSQNLSTQSTTIHGQGSNLAVQSSQQQVLLPHSQVSGSQLHSQMTGSQGQMTGLQGQMTGPQGQMTGPQGQMTGPQGQMTGPQGQMTGTQSQMTGPQGQMTGTQGQMTGPQIQGQMTGPQGQMIGPQGQMIGPQIQGQMTGPQMQGQMTGPQIQGQMTGPQGQMAGPQGQMAGPQGQMTGPHGQMAGPQGQMTGPQGQMAGPQGQMTGPHGQMAGPQGQMTGPQGQMAGPQGQMAGPQGQMTGPQGQMAGPQGQMAGPQGQMTEPQGQMTGPQGQMTGPQGQMTGPQGQMTGPQIQGQMTGPQGQMSGPQSQMAGPQIQGQMTGPQGQMTGPQGQMTGPQIQGQFQGSKFQDQSPGLHNQGQGQGPQMQNQGQGPSLQSQGQGPQMQSHFQAHIPGAQGVKGQYLSQGNRPSVQQHLPGQMPFQNLAHPQQQLPTQQFPYPQQPQGFHQQPGVGATPHQQSFQQQHQPMMQQQLRGPYNPQQQMGPMHGATHQAPSGLHSALSANIATMTPPLQPTNVSGVVRTAAPGQVLSRPSTPGSQTSPGIPPITTSPVCSKKSVSKKSSSLDDILSSSPNGVNDTIITPQVLTDQERQLQKEEALKKQAIVQTSEPYSSPAALHKLLADVEAFGKFVDELSVTILGVSRLDTVWKSLLDSQDAAVKKQSMAIARCYPMKNREPDIMPYDDTRVTLTTTKDDYINASWLNDLAPSCPKFITTQSPMSLTLGEFWAMVYEQGSEVVVQITSEYETGKKYPVYYPVEKDKTLEQGAMLLSLHSVKFRQHWVERIIYLKNVQTKQARTLVHLQYKNWPVSGFPDEISSIVHFISEVHSFYMQQRSLTKPIIVHCGFGIGRTGVFTLVYTAMQEILHGYGLVDVPGLARRMLQKRKGILHKKEQLKCSYDAVLCFAEEYLEKRGILVRNPHFSPKHKASPKHQSQSQVASDDIVLGSCDLQTIRENVGRLRVQTDTERKEDVSGLTDQSLSKKSLESLSSISNSSLPDVVQQYSDPHSVNELDKLTQDKAGRNESDSNIVGLQNQQIFSLESQPTSLGTLRLLSPGDPNLGQTLLPQGSISPTDRSALEALHSGFQSLPGGSVPISLAQLQDPATFTLGSPDSKKKSKITKANFHQSKGTLASTADPGDPLGNLDPLWTLAKK